MLKLLLLSACIVIAFAVPFEQNQKPLIRTSDIDGVSGEVKNVSLTILTKSEARNKTAPYLGGLFFEDISQSGDGGIYGELLRNRAFQGSGITTGDIPNIPYLSIVGSENPTIPFGPVLDGWVGVGDVRLSLDILHPLSDSLRVALQVDVLLNAHGLVGIKNEGWWGINVAPQVYNASFYAQSDGVRFNWTLDEFEVSLRSDITGDIWCQQTIPINNRLGPFDYAHFETTMENKVQAPNSNNSFFLTFDAEKARGQTFYFDLISLFGETYKGRRNGLRKDLAEQLADMKPRYLRFPGGNNMEGYSIQQRWKWWKTIGPLKDRPGRPGDWTYFNTDGLGLLEYLEWCEDMELEPLLAVYAGFSLDISCYDRGNSTDANEYPMSAMDSVLQEALEELEYCMGDAENTYWGKKRAEHGHPGPFNIKMIEIGNEDFFSHNYPKRAEFMYEGLKEKYPNITYIFTALNESSEWKHQIPPGGIWDAHIYAPAGDFVKAFDYFDHFQEPEGQANVSAALMEYHVSSIRDVVMGHPRMGSAIGEAVYAIAGERNPSAFQLSAFAPLIQNLNAYRNTPYAILFTSDPAQTVLSTSYYQQQMFNTWHGEETLPVRENEGGLNPLFWVASINADNTEIYFKVVNAGEVTQTLTIDLDRRFQSVNGTILAPSEDGGIYEFNYIDDYRIVPKEFNAHRVVANLEDAAASKDWTDMSKAMRGSEKTEWSLPGYSIVVLQFNLLPNIIHGKTCSPEMFIILDDLMRKATKKIRLGLTDDQMRNPRVFNSTVNILADRECPGSHCRPYTATNDDGGDNDSDHDIGRAI